MPTPTIRNTNAPIDPPVAGNADRYRLELCGFEQEAKNRPSLRRSRLGPRPCRYVFPAYRMSTCDPPVNRAVIVAVLRPGTQPTKAVLMIMAHQDREPARAATIDDYRRELRPVIATGAARRQQPPREPELARAKAPSTAGLPGPRAAAPGRPRSARRDPRPRHAGSLAPGSCAGSAATGSRADRSAPPIADRTSAAFKVRSCFRPSFSASGATPCRYSSTVLADRPDSPSASQSSSAAWTV
jgi:hypothetical protein